MAVCTESWVPDYKRVIAVFHEVTYLCVRYVSATGNDTARNLIDTIDILLKQYHM